jgi:hypothetical protein
LFDACKHRRRYQPLPDAHRVLAVVVLNLTAQAIPFALKYNGLTACTTSLAHSIMTMRFEDFPEEG